MADDADPGQQIVTLPVRLLRRIALALDSEARGAGRWVWHPAGPTAAKPEPSSAAAEESAPVKRPRRLRRDNPS